MLRTLILLAGLLVVACGGNGDADIRLPDGDYNEEELREFTRTNIAAFGRDLSCSDVLAAETDADLLMVVKDGYASQDPEDQIRPVADVEDADFLILGEITQEECRAASE